MLVNTSVFSGTFPETLKTARMAPLFKSGKKDDTSNYRPISTLSFSRKIFEKVINVSLNSFLNKYNILNQEQFGFQKSKSTSDAVLHFISYVYSALNDRKSVISILLDFSKAFDTVNPSLLLLKFNSLGIRG